MKETRKYTRKCPQCGQKLVRNGTENSKQRWRCLPCGTARIRPRPDVADSNRRKTYTKHLTGKTTATEVAHSKGISRRTFDRNYTVRFHPTVGVEKPPSHTPWIVIDAKCLNQGIVAIVRTAAGRLSWRYAPYESSEVWLRLFTTYPTVLGIVSDGQKGIQKAARICYGDAIILQRCHFHVKQNLQTKLTKHPATAAGQDLQALAQWLARVTTWDDMALFVGVFYGLYAVYEPFLTQRTYHDENKRRWSYTHVRVRSAYRQIDTLITTDQLFAYITHPELGLPHTTNHIEGGLNARISELCRAHRGLLPERQRVMIDEFLTSKQPVDR